MHVRQFLYQLFSLSALMTVVHIGDVKAALLNDNLGGLSLLMQLPAAVDTSAQEPTCEAELDAYTARQYRMINVHQTFAYTTAGLLLAADGMGLYHFLRMYRRGHEIRDRNGFDEESPDLTFQTAETQKVWRDDRSQTERIIHTGLIVLGSLSYTATASIKLTMARTSKSKSPISDTRLHRYAFYLHAGLMATSVALGLVESSALSKGNHNVVQGVGIAHLVVGFSIPVVIIGAGALFKLPNEY